MLIRLLLGIALIPALLLAAHLSFRPPSLEGRSASTAITASTATTLGRLSAAGPQGANGKSGILPLLDGPSAFVARMELIRAAEVSLDVQYYIWQRDATGVLLLNELRLAAERGVRIRLLLDDNGIRGLDAELAALNSLANFEVRLFNPFILRRFKPLGYAFDFVRLNRRMHNKSLTADGAFSILGGRNVGDIYFGFGTGPQFIDTDVLVAGPVAGDVGADFDRYWHSHSAHPIDRLVRSARSSGLEQLTAAAESAKTSADGRRYLELLWGSNLIDRLAQGDLSFEWVRAALVSDDPAKGLGKVTGEDLMFAQLMALLTRPGQSVDLVSAYFVPGEEFTRRLTALAKAGVRVRILTNSLTATDVVFVHSAYVKYRPTLLEAGVELFELKPAFALPDHDSGGHSPGSSRASLHSKALAIDEQRIFIGSFNFDPRSLLLNTEMGILIESSQLASGLAAAFSQHFQKVSYVPHLNDDGGISWIDHSEDAVTRHPHEPGTNAATRLLLRALGLLPIEGLL